MSSYLRLLACCVAIAVAITASWWGLTLGRGPLGVVLITLDTARADHLSVYGYMDVAMPHLDRLAAEGMVFLQATSVAPLTLPAHASLLTGLLPPAHGVRDNADPPLGAGFTTLAEILRDRGFAPAAVVGSVVLDADRGLAQGFSYYSGVGPGDSQGGRRQRPADEVVGDAIAWLHGLEDTRFFLWTHLYDPHRPYDPPEPFRSFANPYVGEIAFADAEIGRLLGALERRGILDRTIVVVAGDHGESLGEHGERDHGIFVYESVLRVPLIIKAPGLSPGHVGEVVRLIDVMPTILDLLGLEIPPTDGTSLMSLMDGTRGMDELEAYAESFYPRRFGWSTLRSLRAGRYKVIAAPRPELYDLERDPFEQRNIHPQRPALAQRMLERLAEFDRAPLAQAEAPPEMGVPDDLRSRLAALGYVGRGRLRRGAPPEGLPDPKDCIALYNERIQRHPKPGAVTENLIECE